MGRRVEIIDQAVAEAASKLKKKLGKVGYIANKLQAIQSAYKHGIKLTAEIFGIDRSSLHRWAQNFKRYGIEGLEKKDKPSRSKINKQSLVILKEWIEKEPSLTLEKICMKFKNEKGLKVGKSSVHRALEKLGFSHITPRAIHHKADLDAQEDFKKN